jgi:hypothetical protein
MKDIALHWPRSRRMTIIWFGDMSVWQNVKLWSYQLWHQLVDVGTDSSMGCVCGWECPKTWRWPAGYWYRRFWNEHVLDCPLERDEKGNLIP